MNPPDPALPVRIFARAATDRLPADALVQNAATHFGATAKITDAKGAALTRAALPSAYHLQLTFGSHRTRAAFTVHTRPRTPEDLADAAAAEARGQAAGMAALAERSAYVWLVEPDGAAPSWTFWECCAILALTALGPILPADGSTLLGVRSARARASELRDARK